MYTIVMTMQITKQKKGGPYTKAQQEQRRNKIYEMHFKLAYSAVKIAEVLSINRNTINEDIKYWYSEISLQFGIDNLGKTMLRQFERFEIQRRRIINELGKQTDFEKNVRLEKFLFELDQKIALIVSKIAGTKRLSMYSLAE